MATELERRVSQLVTENRFSHWLVERKVIDAADMFEAAQSSLPPGIRLGELAFTKEWLNKADVQKVLDIQESTGARFGSIIHRLELLTERQLGFLLAEQSECSDILQEQLIDAGLINAQEAEALFSQFSMSESSGLHLRSTLAALCRLAKCPLEFDATRLCIALG